MSRIARLVLAAALLAVGAMPASAFFWSHANDADPDSRVPYCDAPGVLSSITHRFAGANRDFYSGIESIDEIDRVRQLALVANRPSPLVRRFCRARVHLSDLSHRTMYYMIEEEAGFVALRDSVEFCIRGLDPWYVHDAKCRTVRP